MARKGEVAWKKGQMENLRRLSNEKHLSIRAVATGVGVSKDKIAGGLLPLYREAMDRIVELEESIASSEETQVGSIQKGPPQPSDKDKSDSEASEKGVLEGEVKNNESAGSLQTPVPSQTESLTTRPDAHAGVAPLRTQKETDMTDEGRPYDDRVTQQSVEIASLKGKLERAVEDLKSLSEMSKAHEDALRETGKSNEALESLSTRMKALQQSVEDQGNASVQLAQEVDTTSKQVKEQDGKFANLSLDQEQLDEAMVKCMEGGGKFCDLVSVQMQQVADKGGETIEDGGHDHSGAEEFWACPTCSKALLDALASESFAEIRQSMERSVPEADIPVLLERLQEAGMKVVTETNSIFIPQAKTG